MKVVLFNEDEDPRIEDIPEPTFGGERHDYSCGPFPYWDKSSRRENLNIQYSGWRLAAYRFDVTSSYCAQLLRPASGLAFEKPHIRGYDKYQKNNPPWLGEWSMVGLFASPYT